MKNFNIIGVHWKIRFFGGVHKKTIYGGENCLKRGPWTIYRFKGDLAKRGGDVFDEGVDTPMHTMQ